MTSTHASKQHLDTMPAELSARYLPPSTKPEKFVLGKPVKGRNEPSAIGAVAWVMHSLTDKTFEELTDAVYANTVTLFELDHE